MKFQQTYQTDFHIPPQILNGIIKDILQLIHKRLPKKTKDLIVLDVGSGYGRYSVAFAKKVRKVIGVEPVKDFYEKSLKLKRENKIKNMSFYNDFIENFETKERFDLAINLTTLEHMPNADASFKKIFSLLKDNGVIYITAPNRLWPFEEHYKLFFLSYFPLSVANFYVRLFRKGQSFTDSSYSKTYWGMKKFLSQFPCVYEFIIPEPSAPYLGLGSQQNKMYLFLKNLGINLIKRGPFMWTFSKGFIVVLQKTAP